MEVGKTLYAPTRKHWRAWLQKNHTKEREIWLVYCTMESGLPSIPYEDSMEEALSFGWIDGIIKKLDKDRYTRRFSPRKPGSVWSEINVARYERAKAAGRLTEAGVKAFGKDGTRKVFSSLRKGRDIPPDLADQFKKRPKARAFFETLAPTYQSHYVNWIHNAKRPETRAVRIKKSIEYLINGQKAPMLPKKKRHED